MQTYFVFLTENYDAVRGLNSLKNLMQNVPQSWKNLDPCNGWEGIKCTNSRIISM